MEECSFVYITCKNAGQAEAIGLKLVEERLAACANIMPSVTSIYEWEGQIQQSEETPVFIKTAKINLKKLEARIMELHSYDTPCIISFDITGGNPDFLKWIKAQTAI